MNDHMSRTTTAAPPRLLMLGLVLALSLVPLLRTAAPERVAAAPVQAPVQAPAHASGTLPLGSPTLLETRQVQQLAPGVTYTQIMRGMPSTGAPWTVDLAFTSTVRAVLKVLIRLTAAGYHPRLKVVVRQAPDDPRPGPLGWFVRIGAFITQAEAQALATSLGNAGYAAIHVDDRDEDGSITTGPWVIHELDIDPAQFRGAVDLELAGGLVPGRVPVARAGPAPTRERVSAMDARTGALAGVNGGYFVIGAQDGTPGDAAGITIAHGDLVDEAVNGRTDLILPSVSGAGTRVAAITTTLTVAASDGAMDTINGRNRKPGIVRACGRPGATPTTRPKHDFNCADPDELIQFTSAYGAATDAGPGTEAVLDSTGHVTEVRTQRGGLIPPTGSVLAGIGAAAEWLRAHARPGAALTSAVHVLADGQPLPLTDHLNVVNGGPRLLRQGVPDITAYAEGFVYPEDPEFYYRFGVRRNPRTLAGVTADGHLLLVTVDGRAHGYSAGLSFDESARLMHALGATEALNLDGGGSTTMALGGALVTRPSDTAGERPVGDALLLLAH